MFSWSPCWCSTWACSIAAPTRSIPRSDALECRLDRSGRDFCSRDLLLARPHSRAGVRYRIRHRALAERRQSLRLSADFPFLPGAARPPAQSPVLGNSGRADHARDFHRCRRRTHPEIPLDHLCLRSVAGLQRHQAVLSGTRPRSIRRKIRCCDCSAAGCRSPKTIEGNKFFVRSTGLYATPLFVVLLVVETTDLLFAVDSIPAILAITRDAFIVYTSNVFAILGLRSMYFALAGMMEMFRYLHYGLSLVLVFVGSQNAPLPLFRDPDSPSPGGGRRCPVHLSHRVRGKSRKKQKRRRRERPARCRKRLAPA